MNEETPRDKPKMTPPRLTLVPKSAPHDECATVEAAIATGAEGRPDVDAGGAGAMTPDQQPEDRERHSKVRIVEAVLFAAPRPLDDAEIAAHLDEGEDVAALLAELHQHYVARGINLVRVAGKWAFRTAQDLSFLLQRFAEDERRLSKAALETLAIIAYHQPVTRAEIEEIRGVSTSAGTIDILLETGWIRPRGRRRAPGRPVTYGTTEAFLTHFSLDTIKDLPGLSELKGAGLLEGTLPPGFTVPEPSDVAALMPDELPLEDTEDQQQGSLSFSVEPDEAEDDASGAMDGDAEGAAGSGEERGASS